MLSAMKFFSSFALLDDCTASDAAPRSRLYADLVREHRCTDPRTLDAVCAAAQSDLRAGLHAVLLVDYEWGAKLLNAGQEALPHGDASCLRLLMFRELRRLSGDEVQAWLAGQDAALAADLPTAGLLPLQPSLDRQAFDAAIACIHEAIRAGESYQVNFTYRLTGEAYGEPLRLYRRLRQRQSVPYGAFIQLEDGTSVLSCSPELFLRHEQGRLTARPMKGTSARLPDAQADATAALALAQDAKNRAENLMIVDLLRNDLGRIAQTGSVRVPALFTVEPHGVVWQMTSTIEARALPGLDLPALLRATFPCGSITGAPKLRTMELIAGLESTPRGLYCGAIGWLDAPRGDAACGDFCCSVAIRTLVLGPQGEGGLRPVRMGVGAGIVLDSDAAAEFEECRLKARFATGLGHEFELFETLFAQQPQGFRHLDRHLARLCRSAQALGFKLDEQAARRRLDAALCALPADVPHRVRLALGHDGQLGVTQAPLAPLAGGPAGLLLAGEPLAPSPLSAHKTTLRARYDAGVRAAQQAGAFDTLFFTPQGHLIEGGRSNVFVQLDGRWWTPPLGDGALPGVMREVAMGQLDAAERSLRREDLARAEFLIVCNALRGLLPARLVAAD
ncbi:aminodeoxychorismate synthase component I [Azohydromonas lata]|uniref:aminodeoxychorismate synthase component I n=1 Tax=Azohydromonas lata TaxID=45677 RepID=UPI00082FE8E6|nr:aminodeoxychorismate synthase component I [Azohydromonas lata]